MRKARTAIAAVALAALPVAVDTMPIPPSSVQGSGVVTSQVFVDPSLPIRTRAGKLFVIALPANHTTGYEWSFVTPPNATVAYVGIAYQDSTSGRVGAGGQEVWIFRASQPGSVSLAFRYTRPFDANTQTNARHVTFHVQVTPA